MQNTKKTQQPKQQQPREDDADIQNSGGMPENVAMDDDGAPVLDESDLEENNLSEEEADNVEWENPEK